jgi:hypothetical protein
MVCGTTVCRTTTSSSAQLRVWRRWLAVGASFLLMISLIVAAKAQVQNDREKPYAIIFGTVWDPDGHTLYGVRIKIRRAEEKKARWEQYSNHTGEFAQRVPAGAADYIVWADVKGYKLASGKKLKPGSEVTVHIDNDERSDIGLHLDWLP